MSLPLSIVVPCYNEARRLPERLPAALDYLAGAYGRDCETIFVDDGSTDGTSAVLEGICAGGAPLSLRAIACHRNRGKGWAVRTGVLAARGERIVTMDADFSIDIAETPGFLAALDDAHVAIGTKKHALTRSVRRQGALRRFLGLGFTRLTNAALGLDFTDITCGFKAFRAPEARRLFSLQTLPRWSYDSEILYLARRLGLTVVEIPVRWAHVEGSKVSTVKDVVRSARDLARIRTNAWTGRYRERPGSAGGTVPPGGY